ncbi:Cell division protein FtsW [uncultured Eubacteriales bacterium]|uniref:Probable peptidoglycan glycosyltransferase FtsW n=1 Tax=uncultured Eubacteriales bacterium TaxID=172733 RepID=A0A212J927_9FIRM|nr:Cell division protein FtsW [uncultured Eubacteriales bacterium]
MAQKLKRDLTVEEQLARGPLDMPFLMLTLLLTGIGLIMVFSASYASAYYDATVAKHDPAFYFIRQMIFGVVGIAAMYVISKINYQTFRWMSVFALAGSIVLLILVLPFGYGRATVGAQRWMNIGPINLQPSEVAKLGVIMYFAARLSKRGTEKKKSYDKRKLSGRLLILLDKIGLLELVPYVAVLGVVCVLLLLEPHMSGTILMLVAGASVLFAGGIKLHWFAIGGSAVGAGLWYIITNTSYMASRIQLWLNPWSDPLGKGYQTIQSLLAIGSGGLLGVGLGNSRQKFLYLPEPENDFIFSILCEELGYLGAAIVLILFALLIIRGYWIAVHARDRFGALLVVGITTLMAVQVFLNIAVVTNFFPTTGISLPFFSYGGTALMIQLAEMGIVLSVSRQIPAARQG